MLLQLIVSILLTASIPSPAAQSIAVNRTGCHDQCGNVKIPFPFGTGTGCNLNDWYNISCDTSSTPPKPFLTSFGLEVTEINFQGEQTLSVISRQQLKSLQQYGPSVVNGSYELYQATSVDMAGSPFLYSSKHNIFSVKGCTGSALLLNRTNHIMAGCATFCSPSAGHAVTNGCYGVLCCQTVIPSSLDFYQINSTIGLQGDINSTTSLMTNESPPPFPTPTVLQWTAIDLPTHHPSYQNSYCTLVPFAKDVQGYVCSCDGDSYQGNPYLADGCQVREECKDCIPYCQKLPFLNSTRYACPLPVKNKLSYIMLGVLTILTLILPLPVGFWLYKLIKKRRKNRLKAVFFERNGGLLLRQQMSSNKGVVERTTVFTSEELEKATDHYNKDRILGKGGQGTVYKGMLPDGRIVAIKKSEIVNESQLKEFINELIILSQVNHRNIVKLLGCCLETEVPLLAYEFIPNGTLLHHIHDPTEEFRLTWEMRLQIATDVAGALTYLHSASSVPIYHRDIKSSNILLDAKYRAKLSDFGISRSITVDQTHLTASAVRGTFGYLDPGYFHTQQFTEKSDVYSFGVVVAELLTGQKAVRSDETEEKISLVNWFLSSIEESCLFDILDGQVIKEGRKEELLAVANLARRCLNLDGKRRPTMREVAKELEAINMPALSEATLQENEQYSTEITETSFYGFSSSSMPNLHCYTSLSVDARPRLSRTA